MNNNSALLHIF